MIVAPTRLYRDGVAQVLAKSAALLIAATAPDAELGVQALPAAAPDVILVDVALAGSLPALVAAAGDAKVIAFGVARDEEQVIACAEAGVDGYVECDATLADLENVLRGAVRDEAVCAPWMTGALLRRVRALARHRDGVPQAAERLTVREREVMALVDAGLSNKQIAQHLSIELPTVKNHVHNVLEKLEVSGRLQAAARVRGQA
ncbi:MAG TPA: response regulator transcription factor [Solirubrobacteraceae bacterium]|nr:response regulator transcription factor [Solirubrobacteraceae bacterium]